MLCLTSVELLMQVKRFTKQMEKVMKSKILQPVIEALQFKVNSTLGVFAGEFIEQSDYESLGLLANLGIDLNAYIDTILQSYSSPDATLVIDAEIVDETARTVETPTKVAEVKVKQAPKPKYKFSVPNSECKNWIFDYLGKRGGQATQEDTYKDFFTSHKHLMTAQEIRTKFHKRQVQRRVCEMRFTEDSKNNPINALIEPYTGKKDEYYTLTKYGMELYQKELAKELEKESAKQKHYVQTVLDGMTAEG